MNLPPLTYLTVDSLSEGVGRSQVLPYVERLARRGVDVTVHSFEHASPSAEAAAVLEEAGARWRPHAFGRRGAAGGVARVLTLARAARGCPLVHARSDLAAAAALIARPKVWVWDVRSFWADQRIELGMLRQGSHEERMLRMVERRSAASANAILTLAHAAIPILEARHGTHVRQRAHVIATCVDLGRFSVAPMPSERPERWLFSGSLNRYYDVPLMLLLYEQAQKQRPVELTVLAPAETDWERELADAGAIRRRASTTNEVARHVRASHVGLAICRQDVGDSVRAAMPTKIAEFLASGRPVVVNRGLGDMDAILERYRCGVSVDGSDPSAVDSALQQLDELLADPTLADRCREAASAHFDIERATDELLDVYRRALSS